MQTTKPFARRVLSMLALFVVCGVSLVPRTANASYCVWRVITTRVTVDGELAYETREVTLLYCCPGDARCGYANA
jgi:hypothetical protein